MKLLVEAGASTEDKSSEGKTPIVLAVSSEHVDVYHYLINKKHDSYKLLEDKKVGGTTLRIRISSLHFLYSLGVCTTLFTTLIITLVSSFLSKYENDLIIVQPLSYGLPFP